MRALIADDDRVGATLLTRALEQWNLEVVAAHDGDQAWSLIQKDPGLAIAVLDWMMPGLDGPALCERIRKNSSSAHMYVILLTGRSSPTDLVAGLDAGADDYIVKPFNREELRARVQVGIRVATLQQTLAARVAELQSALSNVKQLSGLLPICSYCKRIRGDQDYWEQVEHYITQHSAAHFSHGICPQCYETVCAQLTEQES